MSDERQCDHTTVPDGIPVIDCCGICSQFPQCLYIDPLVLECGNTGSGYDACDRSDDPFHEGPKVELGELNAAHYITDGINHPISGLEMCRWMQKSDTYDFYPFRIDPHGTLVTCGSIKIYSCIVHSFYDMNQNAFTGFYLNISCQNPTGGPPPYPNPRFNGSKPGYETPFGKYDLNVSFGAIPSSVEITSECNLAP